MDKNRLFISLILVFASISIAIADSGLEVTGVIQGNEPLAIVNGNVVKHGDIVGDYQVAHIENNSVVFKSKDGTLITKELKANDLKSEVERKRLAAKNKNLLFAGMQAGDLNAFDLTKDGSCEFQISHPDLVEPVYAILTTQYLNDLQETFIFIRIINQSQIPINLNFVADEVDLVNSRGEKHKLRMDHMLESYPSLINPGETATIYNASKDGFERMVMSLKDIAMIYCLIDYGKRLIVLKPCLTNSP